MSYLHGFCPKHDAHVDLVRSFLCLLRVGFFLVAVLADLALPCGVEAHDVLQRGATVIGIFDPAATATTIHLQRCLEQSVD